MGLLELLIVIIVIMYLAGLGYGGTMAFGGLIHLLLVILLVVILIRVLQGRSPLP